MAICKLCGSDKKLVQAHVIPRSFWYLDQRRDSPFIGPLAIMSSSGGRAKPSLIGLYDTNILCESCDGRLGKLDQHAAEHLIRGKREPLRIADVEAWRYTQVSPRLLIQFLASVAWRASVSSLPYYSRVNLGPYEVKLKSIGTAECQPGPDFECIVSEYDLDEVALLNPTNTRVGERNFLVLYANRFAFYLKLDKRPLPLSLKAIVLKEGQPVLSIVRPWTSSKEFKLLRKVAQSNPKPAFWKKIE